VVETESRQPSEIDGQRLRMEYSLGGSGGGGGGAAAGVSGGGALSDWLCERCGTINFARFGGGVVPRAAADLPMLTPPAHVPTHCLATRP